jgi:hypothetical protein
MVEDQSVNRDFDVTTEEIISDFQRGFMEVIVTNNNYSHLG